MSDAPTQVRLTEIRENRAKHVAKLRELWNQSLMRWLRKGPTAGLTRSRSKYNPNECDWKRA